MASEMQTFRPPRHRPPVKRPIWIIVSVSLVSLFLVSAYISLPENYNSGCYMFLTSCRSSFSEAADSVREYSDEEIASRVVIREILNPVHSKIPKIAFMFLTKGSLPFEMLWDKFFHVRNST